MKNTSLLSCLFAAILLFSSCGKPMADFFYNDPSTAAPVAVKFENRSKKADSYEWDFGDGEKSQEASPSHHFNSSGNYTVELIAKKGKKTSSKTAQVFVEAPTECFVLMETEFGNMKIKLYDATPKHRDNFIKLVEEGFYDDLLFHRVINGFMVQGGDPKSKGAKPAQRLGSGGPGYTVPAEFVDTLVHVKGALAAARQGDNLNPKKASSGSQFYIVQGNPIADRQLDNFELRTGKHYTKTARKIYTEQGGTPQLDHSYTVFGMVVEGLDVIDKIAKTATDRGSNRPLKDIKMKISVVK